MKDNVSVDLAICYLMMRPSVAKNLNVGNRVSEILQIVLDDNLH